MDASETARDDEDIAAAAVTQNPSALAFVSPRLRKDAAFRSQAGLPPIPEAYDYDNLDGIAWPKPEVRRPMIPDHRERHMPELNHAPAGGRP